MSDVRPALPLHSDDALNEDFGKFGWEQPEFRRGGRDMTPVSLGIFAWGLVTGVTMVQSGLPTWAAVMLSLVAFAGTAQLAILPLLASGAPVGLVWATAACVNLRFAILSAQWRPYFGHRPLRQRILASFFCADLNIVLFKTRFPEPKPLPGQWPYFWGGVVVNASAWHLSSLLGIALAHRIPLQWGLEFAGTLALLGILYSMLSGLQTWLAALLSAAAAVAAYHLPLKLNIVVAIAAAVAVGAVVDRIRPTQINGGPTP